MYAGQKQRLSSILRGDRSVRRWSLARRFAPGGRLYGSAQMAYDAQAPEGRG